MTGFVYRWHDQAKNMYYIGSHWHCKKCKFYQTGVCNYTCSSTWMLRAYKNRPDDFSREILVVVTTSRKDLLRREQFWLDRIHKSQLGKAVYNLRRLANGTTDDVKRMMANEKLRASNLGRRRTPETQAKISAAWERRKESGWTFSPEIIEKMRVAHLGKTASAETRAKLSTAGLGRTPSAETRKKISDAQKGRLGKIPSAETRKKMSDSHKGRIHSPETRKKMSDSQKGQTPSAETRKKLSDANQGRRYHPRSPETCKKISDAALRRQKKSECSRCHRQFDPAVHARWHGERCKLKSPSHPLAA